MNKIAMLIHTNQEQNRPIDKGIVNTVIRFDHGFERDLGKGKTAKMQIVVDGSDSSTAFIILNYAGAIIQRCNQRLSRGKIQSLLSLR